jgi:hypothetical protein
MRRSAKNAFSKEKNSLEDKADKVYRWSNKEIKAEVKLEFQLFHSKEKKGITRPRGPPPPKKKKVTGGLPFMISKEPSYLPKPSFLRKI